MLTQVQKTLPLRVLLPQGKSLCVQGQSLCKCPLNLSFSLELPASFLPTQYNQETGIYAVCLSFTPLRREWLWGPEVLDLEGRRKTMFSLHPQPYSTIHFYQVFGLADNEQYNRYFAPYLTSEQYMPSSRKQEGTSNEDTFII